MRRTTIVAVLVVAAGVPLAGVAIYRLPAPAPAPVSAREQIVYQGSQLIPRGEGLITTYTLYRIMGDRLEELLDVITDRDREAFDNMTAQRLEATLEPATRGGRPAFVYRVRTGSVPERTIVFVWNGKRFEDTSGAYDKIDADNRP